MPRAWIAFLSPGADGIYDVAFRDPAAWVRPSLDWPATAHEALKLSTLLAVAIAAPSLFATRRRYRELLLIITACGLGVLVVGLGNAVLHPSAFDAHGGGMGTSFFNPNHSATFLGFTSFVALAGALAAPDGRKWLYFLASALLAGGVALTLSRAGVAAFALVFVVFLALGTARGLIARKLLWVLGAVAVSGVFVATYVGASALMRELFSLRTPGFNKAELWRVVPEMLRDFPLLGIGRGAFRSVYDRYDTTGFDLTFTHLENELLQTLVDFGPLAGAVIVLGLVVIFLRALMRSLGGAERLAAACGLLFVGLHNLIDFSAFLTGLAIPAVALLGTLGRAEAKERRTTSELPNDAPASAARRWIPRGAALACVVVAVGVAHAAVSYPIEEDIARMRALVRDAKGADIEAAASELIARHPADFVLPLVAVEGTLRSGGSRSLSRWLNHALYVAPRRALPHRMAAAVLQRAGHREQALIEYRLALAIAPHILGQVVGEIRNAGGTWEQVAQLRPEATQTRVGLAMTLMWGQQYELALRVLDEAALLGEESREAGGLEVAARCELALGRAERAQAYARQLERVAPGATGAYLVEAEVAVRAGRTEEALAIIERALQVVGEHDDLLRTKLSLLTRTRQFEAARRVVALMLQRSKDSRQAGEAHATLAEIYREQGDHALAIRTLQKARDLQPANLGVRLRIARLREEMGDVMGATSELRKAEAELGKSPQLDAELARLTPRSTERDEALKRELFLERR